MTCEEFNAFRRVLPVTTHVVWWGAATRSESRKGGIDRKNYFFEPRSDGFVVALRRQLQFEVA